MNYLPTNLWRAMNDVLRAVPHVSATADWNPTSNGSMFTLTIRVDGWGPTLHEAAYSVGRTYPGERQMLADALNAARRAADDQQTLCDIAATFGLIRPLFRDAPAPLRELVPADADNVARMHIERVLADTLVDEHGPRGAADKVVRCVDTLLTAQQTGPHHLRHAGERIEVEHGRIVLQPSHMIGGPALASLHGRMLDLRARVPETLLTAAVGRPLGEIVQTRHATLAAAPIERADTYGFDGLQLTVPSDLVRIGEHIALAQGLASACGWKVAVEDPSRPRAPRKRDLAA